MKLFHRQITGVGMIFFSMLLFSSACQINDGPNNDSPPLRQTMPTSRSIDSLHEAVKFNDVVAVKKFLIAPVSDINAPDDEGFTPLHHARSIDIAKLLLEHGADINAVGTAPVRGGFSRLKVVPLFNLALNKNKMLVEFLLNRGADPNAGDSPVVFAAIEAQSEEILRLLVSKGARLDKTEARGLHALTFAVFSDKPAMVSLIIALDKSLLNKGEPFALEQALSDKNFAMVQLLVNLGADVNQEFSVFNYNAFEMAIYRNELESARLLALNGSQVRPHAFSIPASNGNLKVVKTIFDFNPRLAVPPDHLITAIENRHTEVALEFLRRDVKLTGLESPSIGLGKNSLERAAEMGFIAVVKAIVEKEKTKGHNTSLLLGEYWTNEPILRSLLEAGVDPNKAAKDDLPLLHYVALNIKDTGTAQILIQHGAQVNLVANNGRSAFNDTPLHLAVYNGNGMLVLYLLTKGASASLSMNNAQEGTPLHVAIVRSNGARTPEKADSYLSITKSLLAKGADKSTQNRNLKTARELLTKSNLKRLEFEKLLQDNP